MKFNELETRKQLEKSSLVVMVGWQVGLPFLAKRDGI
jgi:hypothetical protein